MDEYQDTNLAQYAIVRALSIQHPNLEVTGDPDQSIYAWRGANINNILEFERDYPDVVVVRLEQNYRSTQNILRVADSLIAHNHHRKPKSLFTENAAGPRVRVTEFEDGIAEAHCIAGEIARAVRNGQLGYRDCAVLFRVNALSRNLEHALQQAGVPYQIVNGVEFYQRKEIKDVLAYLHLINNPSNDVAFLRVVNTPPRGIGKKSLGILQDCARQHQLPLLKVLAQPELVSPISQRPRKSLLEFADQMGRLRELATDSLVELVECVLVESGYRQRLEGSHLEEDRQRLANIEELKTAARSYDETFPGGGALEEFLEQSSLVNDTDTWDQDFDRVTLMSLHAAKGLEFRSVHVMAVEQGILPHERSQDDPFQLEEERRLLFVGITRGKEQLHLSFTHHRDYRGRRRRSIASPFFMEFDPEAVRYESQVDFATVAADQRQAERAGYDETCQLDDYQPANISHEPPVSAAAVMTAADLLPPDASADVPPDPTDFQEGMLVRHPEYGPGQLTSLSGSGEKATGKVQFFQTGTERTFRLMYSPLRPLKPTV